jgi:hypothetical protein
VEAHLPLKTGLLGQDWLEARWLLVIKRDLAVGLRGSLEEVNSLIVSSEIALCKRTPADAS